MTAVTEPTLNQFAKSLAGRHALALPASARMAEAGGQRSTLTLKDLLDASDLSAGEFADEIAKFWNLPRISLPDLLEAGPLLDRFSHRFLRESKLLPFRREGGGFHLAVADPTDQAAVRAAEIVFGEPVSLVVGSFEDLATVLEERLRDGEAGEQTAAGAQQLEDDVESLRDLASGAPVVRAFNDLLERAVELRASDIHIEPFRNELVVRLRVDGLLRRAPSPQGAPAQALISRIKILAGLNIAERRLPQDGAARVRVGRSELDIRVATMPTQHGESAVIRLLPRDRGLLEMSKLGFGARDEAKVGRVLAMPHGMVVITGPTGSGKTTTLATMLTGLNDASRKILTIEDPVEYEIPGVNQSQTKASIGLTFATALRAFVRQDPDVIMVGEIRDAETAHIAIHAALTGHLVLTTLHTETAAAAVPRLLDLGVEAFLLASTLRAVVAQRLVRILCERCKAPHVLTASDMADDPRYAMVGFKAGETLHRPQGCERCGGTGYRGRFGAFEVLEVNDVVRPLIRPDSNSGLIDRAAIGDGMTTMLDDAVAKCRMGLTTVAEVLRVTTVR